MTMGYIKDNNVYFFQDEKGEFVSVGTVEEYFKELDKRENEKDVELFNELKSYEKHWYLPVPFTKKRLIFSGLKYIGWYTYK